LPSTGLGGIELRLVRILAGEYRLLAELGSDGLSTALLAERLDMERRRVLIRVLSHALAAQGGGPARLRREIATVALIRHSSIVPVYECEPGTDGRLYVVTEWLDGPSVASWLLVHGPLSLATVVDIVGQCSRVLHLGQQFNVRHRALTLDSIFVVRDSTGALRVRVRDFGLPTSASLAAGSRARRRAGPGRLPGHDSAWVDVHLLGRMTYAMLWGEPWLTLEAERRPPTGMRVEVPRAVEAVLMATLQPHGGPFRSATEFWSALRDAAIGIDRPGSAAPDRAIPGAVAVAAASGGGTKARLDLKGSAVIARAWPPNGPGRIGRESYRPLEVTLGGGFPSEARLSATIQAEAGEQLGAHSGQILLDRRQAIRRRLSDGLEGRKRRYRIGDWLVETNAITEEQLQDAVCAQKASGLRLGEILLRLAYVSDRKLREALSKQLRIEFVELDRISIDPKLSGLVPSDFAKRHRVLPIGSTATQLTVVMDDPTDVDVVAELHERTGCVIEVVTATRAAIREAILSCYQEGIHPGAMPPAQEADAGETPDQAPRRLGHDILRREEPPMREAQIEETLTRLQSQYATLLQQHEAARQALQEQEEHFQRLLRERQDLVDGLERLARRLKD
jgi:hypothetical protein